jgi:hypothetical protein
MSEEAQIYVTCSTHPQICKPRLFLVSHRHEYTPPAMEADIIKSAEESTKCFQNRLSDIISHSSEFKTEIQDFLSTRRNLLEILSNTPEVRSFLNYVVGLEAEVETELEMKAEEKAIEEILTGEVEEPGKEIAKETKTATERKGKEYDNLLDALCHAIKEEEKRYAGKSSLHQGISEYIKSFLKLVNWLVDQRNQIKKYGISSQQLQQLLAEVISCDVVLIADEKDQLGSEKSLVVPLDLSPLRISLALLLCENLDANAKNWNRMFCPPVFMMWKDGIPRLVKPYRSLDKHPIMMRMPTFDRDPQKFQEEVERSLRNFRESSDPLIGKLKGLTPYGKRGTHPILIKKRLSGAISCYMDYNPFSIENLRVMDLGCGSGTLLRDAYRKLLDDRRDLFAQIFIYTLLNDITEDPGKGLRVASEKEDFTNRLDLDIRIGDMRDLMAEIYNKKEHFDIALVNRVFDIYGGYGVFMFDKKEVQTNRPSFATADTREMVPYGLDNKVVAFSGVSLYNDLWRTLAFLLGQPVESSKEILFLPGVEMNALSNFFTFKGSKGLDLFKKLLDTAELVLVSVYPGSFESVFPLDESHKKEVFYHELAEPNTYAIVFISKSRPLIDYITTHLT